MHVIRMTDGADVFERINGGFDYLEVVLPDDTMHLPGHGGRHDDTGTPPVQTLYWMALPMTGTTTTATAINTRTSNMTPSANNKTLVYLKTNGDLYTWDATAKTGAGTKMASSVAKYAVGGDANGPVAYIGADGSVHVSRSTADQAARHRRRRRRRRSARRSRSRPTTRDVYFFQNGDLSPGRREQRRHADARRGAVGRDAGEGCRQGLDPSTCTSSTTRWCSCRT